MWSLGPPFSRRLLREPSGSCPPGPAQDTGDSEAFGRGRLGGLMQGPVQEAYLESQ